MLRNVKLGLIGVGQMGRNHLRNLCMMRNVDISFVYDANQDYCKKIAKEFGVFCSDNLVRDLQDIDGAIIVTPTSTHFDYIKLVSKHVKKIFVEKPLTDSLASTQEIVGLASANQIDIQVGFIERYNPAIVAMKKVLKNSSAVINIDFFRTNKVSSRIKDVGVVLDLMIHDIDLAIQFNGSVKHVQAYGHMSGDLIEYARTTLRHKNGSFSNIVASRITEKRIRKVNATCADMYIDCNLLNKEVVINKQTREMYSDEISITSRQERIDVTLQEALLAELIDFVKLVRGEDVLVPQPAQALEVMKVAERVRNCIKEDQCVLA